MECKHEHKTFPIQGMLCETVPSVALIECSLCKCTVGNVNVQYNANRITLVFSPEVSKREMKEILRDTVYARAERSS